MYSRERLKKVSAKHCYLMSVIKVGKDGRDLLQFNVAKCAKSFGSRSSKYKAKHSQCIAVHNSVKSFSFKLYVK